MRTHLGNLPVGLGAEAGGAGAGADRQGGVGAETWGNLFSY